jgi:hypothetical protein
MFSVKLTDPQRNIVLGMNCVEAVTPFRLVQTLRFVLRVRLTLARSSRGRGYSCSLTYTVQSVRSSALDRAHCTLCGQ